MDTDQAGDTEAVPAGHGDVGRDFAPGTYIAERRYRIIARIGEGGMGVVYRADDLLLNVPVALKRLTPNFAARWAIVSAPRSRQGKRRHRKISSMPPHRRS